MVHTSLLADGLHVFKRTVRAAKREYVLAQTKCSPRKGVAQNKQETKEEGWTCASCVQWSHMRMPTKRATKGS